LPLLTTSRARRWWTGLFLILAVMMPACGQAQVAEEMHYVAAEGGRVYFWVGCDAWRSRPPERLRWFATAADAEAAGYSPSQARGCEGPERTAGPTPIDTGFCTVERIVDGDTLVCAEAAQRIRMLTIDAPELSQGEAGRRAREELERLLPIGDRARLELDVQERDRFGRILAYLHAEDGRLINEEMVRSGYAVVAVYPPNVRHVERLRVAAEEARRENRGLWAEEAFDCPPADHRAGRCP
jgi:micrococcal nuclease